VYAVGRADPHDAIKRAAALRPGAIVLVTGKAFDLEDEVVDFARDVLAGSHTKVHTVAVGSDDDRPNLARIAKEHGGRTRHVTKSQLGKFSD
jgi:hypothetical protein